MRSMTFQIDDQSTGSAIPAVLVTITENDDGTVSFTLTVVGSYTGDLRGFFFDIADENLIDTLAVTSASAGLTEFRQANDTVGDLGDGSNMDGLRGSDGGYDAGIEIGTAGIGSDDYRSFSFTLASSAGALTLEDFANVDFGVRLTSVGLVDGSRNGSAKLLEHTSSAIDAQDVLDSVDEDAPTPATGNVFGDEPHPADRVIAVTHSTNVGEVGVEIRGTYGTLLLNCDGSYIYRLDNTNPTVQALAVGEVLADPEIFTYTARRSDEATSSSTDSAELKITIVGTNDDVLITGADATGHVAEDADATADAADALSASGAVSFADVDLSDGHSATFSASASNTPALGTFALEPVDETPNASGGSVRWSYTLDNAAAQSLAADDTVTETYTVTVDDGHGSTAAQDVTVTIHGTNDRPDAADDVATPAEDSGSGILRVAVIGTANSSVADAAAQLEDSSVFLIDADAIPMSRHFSAAQWTAALADYDAVVVGSSGFADAAEFQSSQLFPALRSFVDSGGGVVTTGWFTFDLNNMYGALYSSAADADYISPVARNAYTWSTFGTTISVSDPAHPITQGISSYVVNTGNHEQTTAVDATATRLASGPAVFGAVNTTAIAYDEVGEGLTAYVGGLYLANPFYGNVPLRSGVLDQILEQAVAWVANGQSPRLTEDSTFTIAAEALLANDADIDAGDTLSILSVSTAGLLGASVSLDSNGDVVYDPVSALQYLGAGETASDTFTYTVTDNHGATDSATVTLTVTGRNDAPDITGGTTTGLVYEDGAARVARGQLAAFDVDHNAAVSWSTVGAPAFGFATVDGAGRWTYTLDNTRFATQQLKQDPNQVATDTFLVRATDEHGAFDTQTVTVSVVGTNDRPNLPPFTLALSVSEDGGSGFTQTSAFDVDNGSVLHWSLNRGSTFGYFSDYEFKADSFSISRNGVQIFHDEFDAGGPPPSAPNFSNDTPANYTTTGLLVEVVEVEELDGKLVMRGDNAFAFRGTGNNALIVGNEAILATNVDPANTVNGLKKNHQFVVESVFDLIEPELGRQQYGIQLTDGVGQLADDLVALVVRRDANDGQLYVRLSDNNAVLDVSEAVASELLVPGSADQIRLRLSHEADSGNVSASYELLEKNADDTVTVIGDGNLGSVGIFGTDTAFAGDDNNWIRAGLIANAFDADEFAQTLAGNYGTLTVRALPTPPTPFVTSVAQLTYTPDNANPAVQALAQGESVVDSFFVRTVDQFGMSTPQRVEVTVNGVNDAPDITDGTTTGLVYEDGGRVATGQLSAIDIDNGIDLITWEVGSQGTRGFAQVDATGKWTYTLRNEDQALVQALAQGTVVTDTFTVRARDQHLAFDQGSEQTVTVEIRGTNDRPGIFVLPPPPGQPPLPAPSVTEDSALAVSRQVGTFDIDAGDTRQLSVSQGTPLGYRSNFVFSADEFTITRDGNQILHDTFADGVPPPSAPNFNATPGYFFAGVLTESGGRLIMDGSKAGSFRGAGFDGLVAGIDAVLNTNVDSANTVNGLKLNHNFTVEAVFDLVVSLELRQGYGLSLSDSLGGPLNLLTTQAGDDFVDFGVRRNAQDGQIYVQLTTGSAVTDTSSVVQRVLLPLDTQGDQIRLRLTHAAGSGQVEASFVLLDNGVPIEATATTFEEHARLFGTDTPGFPADDERYTRASLSVSGIDVNAQTTSIPGLYGTLSVQQDGNYTYALNNGAANVQALAQGEFAVDAFHVRVTDSHGFSSALPVNVTVNGANDPVVITSGPQAGVVLEHAGATPPPVPSTNAAGTITFSDVDLRDGHSVAFAAASSNTTALGAFALGLPSELPNAANGSVGWTYTLDNAAAQYLRAGETAIERYLVTVTDNFGAAPTQEVTITVVGADENADNTPPQAVADTNGLDAVIEMGFAPGAPFGDAFASGNVLTNDIDPDPNPGLRVIAVNGLPAVAGMFFATGTYGGLHVLDNGTWNYTLQDFDFNTNALSQGEAASDVFTYTVQDGHGASATTTLTIAISGTNDFPTLEPVGNTGDVTEGGQSTTSGQLVGSDPDHGAILTYGLPFQPSNGFAADYLFSIDQFTVTRLRPGDAAPVQILNDDFGDGAPPPSGFFDDNAPAYFSTGTFTEADGRAVMDGDAAQLTFNFGGGITVGHTTVVTTSTGTDLTRGLRATHSFDATAQFDAIVPEHVGQAYGVALTDQRSGFGGDDHIQLLVRRDEDGVVRVVMREADAAANSLTPIDRIALGAVMEGDQIVLHLTHEPVAPGTIVGSFEVLRGTEVIQAHTFDATGQVFGTETPGLASDDETFTRAMFLATSPAQTFSRTGIYGTVVLDQSGEWEYVLNNADPDTQALAQGATAVDSFDALAIDQFRTAGIRPIQVTVRGTNDAPVALSDAASAGENETIILDVLANDDDVDTGAVLTLVSASAPAGQGTASVVGNELRFQPGADFDDLAAGETELVTLTYTMRDEHGAQANSTVSLTVTGADDVEPSGTVFEDGPRRDSGQLALEGLDPSTVIISSVAGSGPMTLRADYRFLIDNLSIVRNGSTFFSDDFGNGVPPPAGTTLGYGTSGTFQETGGRVIMDGGLAAPGFGGFVGHFATLFSDTSADMTQGLKSDDTFTVEARFDLVLPAEPLQSYGVRLTDAVATGTGNDIVDITVRRLQDGSAVVALRETDVAGGAPVTLGSFALNPAPGDNQIVLRLNHVANSGIVSASFDLLNGNVVTSSQSFGAAVGHIFSGEPWTRVQIPGSSPGTPQNGVYGTLSVQANGEWKYSLNNAAANVQALAQGEHAIDSFMVSAMDGSGAGVPEAVDIDVVGANDAPFAIGAVTTPQIGGYVIEDGQRESARWQFIGSDIDHGAQLQWSLSRNPYSSPYLFRLDDLNVVRNGAAFFNDGFNDNVAPPSAPPTFSYLTSGGFSEAGGRLLLNGSVAAAQRGVGVSDLTAGQLLTVVTNADPRDNIRGLKSDDDFTVEARFELDLPGTRQGYGVTLTDNITGGLPPDQLGDDLVAVEVVRDGAGNLLARMVQRDVVADTLTVLQSVALEPAAGEDQIVLRLDHAASDVGVVHGSFDLYDNGVFTRRVDFGSTGRIFGTDTPDYAGDDENWTRVQVLAFGPDQGGSSVEGTYGTLSIDQSGQWTYTLNNADPDTQALGHGQAAIDAFNVRVADEYGVSTSRPVGITVVGTSETPVLPVNIIGATTNEILIGSPSADRIAGGGGSDILIGLAGADTFDYNTIFEGVDNIGDFTAGAGGDVLDIRDLLVGYVPGVSNPANFVQLQPALNVFEASTAVMVNADGVGTDVVQIATLQGVTGLLLNDLVANGNLVLA